MSDKERGANGGPSAPAQEQAPPKKFETEVRLSREMGLADTTLIGVGAMIGAGIFVLTGIAAGVAGPALIVVFVLNGIVALITAMSYAELGSCYHDAGGGYLWVKEGLPKWNGFLSGWMSWFAHAVACSLYAIGFGAYFEETLHELGVTLPHILFLPPQKVLAAAVAILFAYVNFRGASETGKVGNLVTIAKIIVLMVFIGFGLNMVFSALDWKASYRPFAPHGYTGIVSAMGLTFIAFQGFEVISQCSEEVKNPRRNIPLAVFLSLLIVIPIYLLVAFTALGSVRAPNMSPWDYLALHKETALVEVARNFFAAGGVMILAGGLVSTMSALNATVYSSSRVAFAMGRDRNFPAFFSKVHTKKFTPHRSIFVTSIIVILMAVSLPIEDVASAADIMFLLLFLQVNAAMIRLRKKRPDLDRGFKTPLFPWLSILGIILLFSLAAFMFTYSPKAWIVTGAWIILGVFVYTVYASKREVAHVKKVSALERLERKEYRILVCLSNPKTIESLVEIGVAIAKKNRAKIIFLHVIEVSERDPLMAGLADINKAKPLLHKAESCLEGLGISYHSILDVAHRISQGIVETAAEEDCNFIIMGRQKQPKAFERFFSSIIETVLQKSPCEVALLHGELTPEKIRNILIPFGKDVHTSLAAEAAPAFMEHFGAKLNIAVVLEPDITQAQKEEKLEHLNKLMVKHSLAAATKVITDMDVLRGIILESRKMDLIIMGGRSGGFFELLLGQSLSQEITERAMCPVLWLKEYEEREPFWSSLIKRQNEEGGENG